MKMLYVSCHAILEYDEVRLFTELGIDVFSTGAYAFPQHTKDKPRPGIWELKHYPEFEHLAGTILSNHGLLPQELIDWADTIVYMHQPEYLAKNWPKIKNKRVIFRSIGQMVPHQEQALQEFVAQGLEVVRYSPKERMLTNYAGETTLIRFYKDPEDYEGYTGEKPELITMCQSIKRRGEFCLYNEVSRVMQGFPHKYYGYSNEELGEEWGGPLEFYEQQQVLQQSRAFVYGGTWPAAYTLSFIEAFMTGIPIIALGRDLANNRLEHLDYYEVEDFITTGVNGFVSSDIDWLRLHAEKLLMDNELAKQIGAEGRKKAIELFGKDTIKLQWKEYLQV